MSLYFLLFQSCKYRNFPEPHVRSLVEPCPALTQRRTLTSLMPMQLEETGNWAPHLIFCYKVFGAWRMVTCHGCQPPAESCLFNWPALALGTLPQQLQGDLDQSKSWQETWEQWLSHRPARQPSGIVLLHPVTQAQDYSLGSLSSRGCSARKRPLQSRAPPCSGFVWTRAQDAVLPPRIALAIGDTQLCRVISYSEVELKTNCSHIIKTTEKKSQGSDRFQKQAFWFSTSSIPPQNFVIPYLNLFHCVLI